MPIVNVSLKAFSLTTNAATVLSVTPFNFPIINGFSGAWTISPLDKVFFYEADGATIKPVYSADMLEHSSPVQIDRFGNIPTIFLGSGDCQVVLKNRYSVKKYAASRISGTWYLGQINYINANTANFSLTTYPATITGTLAGVGGGVLLEDGLSYLLLEDGTSKLLLG